MTRDYYSGGIDAILDVLEGIDDGWDLETVTNHCELEVARLARVRREKFGWE